MFAYDALLFSALCAIRLRLVSAKGASSGQVVCTAPGDFQVRWVPLFILETDCPLLQAGTKSLETDSGPRSHVGFPKIKNNSAFALSCKNRGSLDQWLIESRTQWPDLEWADFDEEEIEKKEKAWRWPPRLSMP